MAERAGSADVVSYREGDTPVRLPALALVGVKLIGLYLIVRIISGLALLPIYLLSWDRHSLYMLLGSIIPSVLDVAIGVALIWKAEWIVSRMHVPADETPSISPNEHFQGIAFSVLGVVLIAWALGDMASLLATFAHNQAMRNAGSVVSDLGFGQFLHPIVMAAAGMVLFLRGAGLAALWHRMRYGGVRVRPAE